MLKLLFKSFKYNWNAHASTPVNLWAAVVGMVINNIFFLYGMWIMMFEGKEQNKTLFPYVVALMTFTAFSWGLINFFLGGLIALGEYIDDGALEPMLGTPRSPLLLTAISQTRPAALGDVVQGILTWIWLTVVYDGSFVWKILFASIVSFIAFLGVFILAGSLAFFLSRGSQLASFVIELTLSFSLYPTGKIFYGPGRYILWLTPALVAAVLPMEAIENASLFKMTVSFVAALALFGASVWIFTIGIRRYRAASYVSMAR